jgi:hypothetical protein
MAVTKIACGTASGAGTRLKGRARNEVHRPDSRSRARSPAPSPSAGGAPFQPWKATCCPGPSSGATSITSLHPARGRRRVAYARQLLVLEDRLAAQHRVAGLHEHRGLEPHVVGPQQGHAGHGGAGLDRLDRGAGNREIQPALDRVHRPGGPLRRAMAGASPSRGKGRGVGPRAIDVNQPGGCLYARRGWVRRLFVQQRANPARRSCRGPGLLSGGHGAERSRRRCQVEGRLKRPAHRRPPSTGRCRPHEEALAETTTKRGLAGR